MTQHEKIWAYLQENYQITPMEAFEKLHITKLATRIGEMIRAGFPIYKMPVRYKAENGETVNYTKYTLY